MIFQNRGFTLIEVILVVAILSVIVATTIPFTNKSNRENTLIGEGRKLTEVLSLAQNRAGSSQRIATCSDLTTSGYRVTLNPAPISNYTLDICCNNSCSTLQTYTYSSDTAIILPAASSTYLFRPQNAFTFASNTIRFKSASISKCVDITLSPLGLISLSSQAISC